MPVTKKQKLQKYSDEIDPNTIFIKGARSNNLKNIDLAIPKNKLVVVTGVSGSGKSSITMDTLYAEGQRRYVESLSSYARQFLMRMKKPDLDYIKGICPAIAIEQKVSTSNARSTVGTLTELYDFLRILFARIGVTYSPISGEPVRKHEVTDVVEFVREMPLDTRILIHIPLQQKYTDRLLSQELAMLLQKSYTRLQYKGQFYRIEDVLEEAKIGRLKIDRKIDHYKDKDIRILIDRLVVDEEEETFKRLADSAQTAFYESEGECWIEIMEGDTYAFNNRFELDGRIFAEPSPQLFNYNNPYGACPQCEGYGRVIGIDEAKVIPNPSLSVYEGAVACWRGEKGGKWLNRLLNNAHQYDFPVHKPYKELSKEEKRLLWKGNAQIWGIHDYFDSLSEKMYKIQNRVMLARYRGRTTCPSCEGGRLREDALFVKIGGKNISDLVEMPIDELLVWFRKLELDEYDAHIAKRLLLEVENRLKFMCDVGLSYLTLDRLSSSLSGGETQRINLTRTLGSNLTSSMYILDEPSVGLHPHDTKRLVSVLQTLRDLGNTVIVVEHEEDVIANADYLIDMGPEAGRLGGEVVFAGPYEEIYDEANDSLTAQYMSGRMQIPVPPVRRKFTKSLQVKGANQHNLQNIDVQFPINTLTVVTGVSGSGKTTLVKGILFPALKRHFGEPHKTAPGQHSDLTGDLKAITTAEMIGQNPLGKSSRSNPVTYVKAYDLIRSLMSRQQLSKIRGFKPGFFSFNTDGGRCETCKGEGEQVVEMQFLADIRLTCEECNGKRFKKEILDVRYKEKNIYDILQMTIDEAIEFFADHKDIIQKIKPLQDVGLGYVQLGQSSSTLSGGEAQRVKLAAFLGKENTKERIFFIFDEPTTGLHFHDIGKLLSALQALVERGHTVVVVEHNMEVIKSADWVIDLGPGGGRQGGHLVFQGRPEDLVEVEDSLTGSFLREKLAASPIN